MRSPIAYIRRSAKSKIDPGDISREFQTETVRRLAGNDANLVVLDGDWGKSAATDETDKRLAFLGLMDAIERGEVSTLYAYSTDRLARSVRWAAQLLDACEKAGTTIVTSEGRFAPGDDMARTMFQFQAIQNEGYSRQAKAKRRSTVERQRAKGMKLGAPYYGKLPGEDLDAVIAAFDRTGSLNGAATELNRLGVPSRRGHWAHSSLQRILARAGLVPTVGVRGARHHNPHRFSRLLVCHCSHVMTGAFRSGGAVIYRCIRAETDPAHGRKSVAEGPILEWAMGEMARLRPPEEPVALTDLDAERHELEVRLGLLREGFLMGLIDQARVRADKAAIDEALMRLDLAGRAVRVPPFEWDHSPRDVNLALRALWGSVQLGPDLRPLRAEWLLPDSWIGPTTPRSPAAPRD